MPYNNAYNRSIAHRMGDINERYAHLYSYSPVDGRGNSYALDGGASAGVLFQMGNASKRDAEDNIVNDNVSGSLPPVYYYGNSSEEMKGGNGFAQGTYRDRGDGSQMGVEAMGHFDKGAGMSGGGWFDTIKNIAKVASHVGDIANATGNVVNTIKNIGSGSECGGSKMGSVIGSFLQEKHGAGMSGGSFWEDLGNTALSLLPLIALGKPRKLKGGEKQGAILGKMLQERMQGKGMSGGSFWEDLGNTALSLLPMLALGKPRKMKGGAILGAEDGSKPGMAGGAILGNPDPYPVQGNSKRIAGRGRGRPKKGGAVPEMVGDKQHDLLAMPGPVLANGVPPTAQLRGSYGGSKPADAKKAMKALAEQMKEMTKAKNDAQPHTIVNRHGGRTEEEVKAGVPPKSQKGKGKNLAGMTDKRAEMEPKIEAKMGAGDGRKKRAEIVKKVMKEKGLKMIEASKFVKEHGLYKP
jgi:hypothetical protein